VAVSVGVAVPSGVQDCVLTVRVVCHPWVETEPTAANAGKPDTAKFKVPLNPFSGVTVNV
jgi:hypothetical protein